MRYTGTVGAQYCYSVNTSEIETDEIETENHEERSRAARVCGVYGKQTGI